ncbi:hypothetical protein [Aestuariivirga sp.]|uniref:hypothetical protein n=1 Tax=Aestuariivirga sp. TaxID=2650926 RepID=UPI0039E3C354
MMSETAEVVGLVTVKLPDGRVFKEQGRLVLTQRKSQVSGAGFIRTSVNCEPGTVVDFQIEQHLLKALVIEVERFVTRFIVHMGVQDNAPAEASPKAPRRNQSDKALASD